MKGPLQSLSLVATVFSISSSQYFWKKEPREHLLTLQFPWQCHEYVKYASSHFKGA